MNKLKILPLAASLLLAAIFTLSCTDSDDDSDLLSKAETSSPGGDRSGGFDALPAPPDKPLVDHPVDPILVDPQVPNPPVPDAVEGSLDGAWQKGPALLKIGGRYAYLDLTGNRSVYGAISYNKSGGSFQPANQDTELVIGFRYTLNGNVLIFSDVTGDIFDALSGEWTEFVGTPGTPNPMPTKD